jgi:hypothetical protein
VIFNRECRVPFVLALRPRLAFGLLPGLMRAMDRFTARSPSSGVGDYFRFLLHRGVSQPPDPNLDRIWVIVPVTVSRASSAASGRCHPALTGVGAVPCGQNRLVTASCSSRITLLRPRGVVADHSMPGWARTTRLSERQGRLACGSTNRLREAGSDGDASSNRPAATGAAKGRFSGTADPVVWAAFVSSAVNERTKCPSGVHFQLAGSAG